MKAKIKNGFAPKICVRCNREFEWRKKWARDWEKVKYCSERCRRDGNLETAAGISAAVKSIVIDNRDGKEIVIAGSLVTSRENYSGFWIIEADNEGEAEVLAKAGSKACNRKVELRPFLK